MYMRYLFLISERLLRNIIKSIACLCPGSWIGRHACRDTVAAAYNL